MCTRITLSLYPSSEEAHDLSAHVLGVEDRVDNVRVRLQLHLHQLHHMHAFMCQGGGGCGGGQWCRSRGRRAVDELTLRQKEQKALAIVPNLPQHQIWELRITNNKRKSLEQLNQQTASSRGVLSYSTHRLSIGFICIHNHLCCLGTVQSCRFSVPFHRLDKA